MAGISVIVPAYNERAVAETVQTLKQTLSGIGRPSEIIVVDDGSQDDTGKKAESCAVRVIRHAINSGYGKAILTGIDASTYDTIVIVDADGTYPSDMLPDLLKIYERGFDMVVGARQGKHYHPSLFKRLQRNLFRFLAEFSTGRSIPDINSGFRIFRKGPVLDYRSSISTGFSFTTTTTLLFLLNGHFVGYHPIVYRERVGPSKVRLLRDGARSLQIIITAIAQFNPLKLLLVVVFLDLIGTALCFCAAVAAHEIWAIPALIAAIGCNSFALLVASGIIAVGRLQPNHTIKSQTGMP